MKQFWQIQQFEQNLKRGVSDFRWHYFLLLNWLYIVWCICQMHQSQVSELASSSAWKELSLAFADERLSNACTEAFENCVPLLSGFWNGVCLQHSFKKAACLVHHSLCLLLKCQQLKEAVTISLCCLNIIVFADVVIHGCVTQKFHRVPTYGSNEIQIEDVNFAFHNHSTDPPSLIFDQSYVCWHFAPSLWSFNGARLFIVVEVHRNWLMNANRAERWALILLVPDPFHIFGGIWGDLGQFSFTILRISSN